jgi:tetratricopeptide (TPR) repeat protein
MIETEKRKIRVFIASPNDLAEERRVFRSAIDQLNDGFGDGANVEYVALGWEDTLASTGRRSQGIINKDIDSCDVFILAMHRRWGQDAPDAGIYSSYTEEEFHRAMERWKKDGTPEIFVFFKRVDAAFEADAGPQLKKVIEFRKQLEETRKILYHYFDSLDSFLKEVDTHLRAYAKGELPKAEDRDDTVVLPIVALQEVENAKQLAMQKTEEARQANDVAEKVRLQLETMQLHMAEDAAQLAKEGKIEFAREKFTKLVTETMNLRILYLAYEFFERTGDLDSAFEVLQKWLSLSGAENKSLETAHALNNFGNLYFTRGEMVQAKKMYIKSLKINEELGSKKGMATQFCNLGNLYFNKGDYDNAERMYNKSLKINHQLGNKEGMSSLYGNLGVLEKIRGEFSLSEKLFRKSLVINEKLANKEGMATQYCNLGNLYFIREEYKKAEEMYRKSLKIDEALGRKEGIAASYINLGVLYMTRRENDLAEKMYRKALVIEEALGHKKGVVNAYDKLRLLYQSQGLHEKAMEMSMKSKILYSQTDLSNEKRFDEWLQASKPCFFRCVKGQSNDIFLNQHE